MQSSEQPGQSVSAKGLRGSQSGRVQLVCGPGLFRLGLAYTVFASHVLRVHLGTPAVYLFFTLSGYWVYRMWVAEYAPTARPYLNFIVSRAWRLLPVYYFCLCCMAVLLWFIAAPGTAPPDTLAGYAAYSVSHILLVGYACLPMDARALPPVWSLDIEMQFYVVAPALIVWLQARDRTRRPWLLGAAAFVAAVAFATALGTDDVQTGILPCFLAFFLVGVFAAQFDWQPSRGLVVAGVSATVATVAACLAVPALRSLLIGDSHVGLGGHRLQYGMLLTVMMAPYAIATVNRRFARGSRVGAMDRILGNLAYEIYLVHWFAVVLLAAYWPHGRVDMRLASMVAVSAAACAVYAAIDRPMDRLRRQFVKSRPRADQARSGPAASRAATAG